MFAQIRSAPPTSAAAKSFQQDYQAAEDITRPLPLDLPMVLMKPPEACSTAEVYELDQTSSFDPLVLLSEITQTGISQDVCINDLEPPAFQDLLSLKRLRKRVLAASRGQYNAVFMSGRSVLLDPWKGPMVQGNQVR